MSDQRLIDPALFGDDQGSRLAGSECGTCGTTTFPAQQSCPRCGREGMSVTPLPADGTIWAYTVQCFPPKPPFRHTGDFTPFGLGYVDLGPVIVESRLTVSDPDALRAGQRVRLTLVPAYTDEDGRQVMTFAFEPVMSR